MDKKITMTVVGASALALGLGVTDAHAEEVTTVAPTTIDQTVSNKETKPEVKKEVTKGQVDDAKDKLDKSKQAVEDAQAKKKQAQFEKDNAQSEVDNAQSEVNNAQQAKDKATPGNIEKQNQSVASAKNDKSDAENQEKNAEDDLDKAKEVVENQEKVVKKSEDNVTNAENDVKDAQTNVDNAQAILDGTGQTKVVEEKENAETAQKKAQEQLTSAEKAFNQAELDDKERADEISSVQKELTDATKVVVSTGAKLTDAIIKAEQTQTALEQAQDTFTMAESSYKAINTIQLTDAYVKALKDYATNPYHPVKQETQWQAHYDKAVKTLTAEQKPNINLNSFKSNVNDKAISVDANNLTTEQMTELSLFASDLLNQIRERFGTPKTVVTKGMLQVADEVTDGYVADDWGFGKGHDSKAVNNVARKYGLPTYEDDTHQYLENLNSSNNGDKIHTMDDAKKWVYESIYKLMFSDWEWEHAQNLAGLSSARGATKEYFGLDISKTLGRTSVHFLTVSDNQVTGNKLDKTEVPNNASVESIVKAYNAANSALLNAQTVNSQAQREKTSASIANIRAKGEQETIQKRLDGLKDTPLKTPTAQSNLEKAQDTLANANKRLENAEKALEALTADVKTKQENLTNAKNVLAQKEANLTNAKTNLATEQDKLTELKALVQIAENNLDLAKEKVEQANKTLEQAKADLENLLNAEPNLAKAKEVLAQKETTLKEKVTALKDAQENLDKLLKEQKLDQEAYDKLFALYSEQVEAKRLADLEAQKKAILEAGNTPVEVYDETGKLVSYQVKSKTVSQSPVAYNGGWDKKQDKSLPNTGEKSSALGLTGLAMFFGALGLVSPKRKKQSK